MIKYLFLLLLSLNSALALEIKCNFEEVYGNGEIQQGFFFLKNQNLRYEYYDKKLFTIIAKNGNFYLINRAHKNNVSKINKNTEVLKMLMNIASKYPNIKNKYNYENTNIIVEKSSSGFIKRVSVNSENVNVSINFLNCNFESINNKYFKHFNFEEVIY